jgi:TonB-linked SusC/RagA family outer membrane protein
VSAKDLRDIPINSAAEALNGRLAGVTATTAEGSPDAQVRIRVRGGMSITGDNSPLYIVDGVQVENALNFLSPQQIQSIDVLKDAAATAIYGARALNGAVIITTKSGRPGKMRVTYSGSVGVKFLAKKLGVMTPYDYVVYQSERSRGSSQDSVKFVDAFGHTWDTLKNYLVARPIDWQEEVFGNTGVRTSHNVTVSGGNKWWNYLAGYTFDYDRAVVIYSDYRRHLFDLKNNFTINRHLSATLGIRGMHQNVQGAGVSDTKGSSYNRLRNAVKYRPFINSGQDIDDADPLADPNVGNGLNLINPLQLAAAEYRAKVTHVFNLTASATYKFMKHFTFKTTFSYDNNFYTDEQYSDSTTPYSVIQGAKKPIAQMDSVRAKTTTNSNTFLYTLTNWRDKHDLTVLVGEETYDYRVDSKNNLIKSFPSFTDHDIAFHNPGLGTPFAGYSPMKRTKTRYTNVSFFGRVTYAYKDKYLLSANARYDGASKFAPGKKFGFFPGGSVAWRVKKESFLENVEFLNDLKFRFGIGTVGNNRISDYQYLTTFNLNNFFYGINGVAVPGYTSNTLANPNLKWESTVNKNYGVDISFLNKRFDLSVDYYDNTSRDLLIYVPIASTYGYDKQYQNVAKASNKGFEIQLNAGIIDKPKNNFTWNANFNIAFNKNKILALGTGQNFFYPSPSWGVSGQPADYIERVGDPVGSMWGLVTDGFYTVNDFNYSGGVYTLKPGTVSDSSIIGVVQPGAIRFKDLNGDGTVNLTSDRQIIGNPTPKFTGGLSQTFTYKNWDANVFVNFSYGNDIYNANKIELTNGYANNANMLDIMSGRWKVVTETGATAQWVTSTGVVMGIAPDQLAALNANATIWQPIKAGGAFYPHSWAIEDGSFLRINNVTIGYKVPASKLKRLGMSSLRLYVTGNNLHVFTKYTGYDPEVSVKNDPLTPGLDYSAYPKSRSFTFGINASF